MFLDRSFCTETGQIKSGTSVEDTFHKMLQHVHRVTPHIADSITSVYGSVYALVHGFQRGGPDILEDLPVHSAVEVSLMLGETNKFRECVREKDRACNF
jgi:hypothetical protein